MSIDIFLLGHRRREDWNPFLSRGQFQRLGPRSVQVCQWSWQPTCTSQGGKSGIQSIEKVLPLLINAPQLLKVIRKVWNASIKGRNRHMTDPWRDIGSTTVELRTFHCTAIKKASNFSRWTWNHLPARNSLCLIALSRAYAEGPTKSPRMMCQAQYPLWCCCEAGVGVRRDRHGNIMDRREVVSKLLRKESGNHMNRTRMWINRGVGLQTWLFSFTVLRLQGSAGEWCDVMMVWESHSSYRWKKTKASSRVYFR